MDKNNRHNLHQNQIQKNNKEILDMKILILLWLMRVKKWFIKEYLFILKVC